MLTIPGHRVEVACADTGRRRALPRNCLPPGPMSRWQARLNLANGVYPKVIHDESSHARPGWSRAGPSAAHRWLTAKAAPWSTMPFIGYMMCAMPGLPPGTPLQMSSPGAHNSVVLGAYGGPMTTGGRPFSRMN